MKQADRSDAATPDADDDRRLQFSLRGLLLAVAVVAGLCGVMVTVRPLWAVAIVWFLALIAAHVAGNSFSTKVGRQRPAADDPERPAGRLPVYAPVSRLRHHVILGRSMFITAAVTSLVGCVLGVVYLLREAHGARPPDFLIAATSATVLGGLIGFVVSSFLTVATCAFHEACFGRGTAGEKQEESGGRVPSSDSLRDRDE